MSIASWNFIHWNRWWFLVFILPKNQLRAAFKYGLELFSNVFNKESWEREWGWSVTGCSPWLTVVLLHRSILPIYLPWFEQPEICSAIWTNPCGNSLGGCLQYSNREKPDCKFDNALLFYWFSLVLWKIGWKNAIHLGTCRWEAWGFSCGHRLLWWCPSNFQPRNLSSLPLKSRELIDSWSHYMNPLTFGMVVLTLQGLLLRFSSHVNPNESSSMCRLWYLFLSVRPLLQVAPKQWNRAFWVLA